MTTRDAQAEETREKIVMAALAAFSELGFHRASTREIAARAGANQGLITYHFRSKELLWQAALGRLFDELRSALLQLRPDGNADARDAARDIIRQYVRFAAAHPELFWLLVDEGKSSDSRLEWLVDTHLKSFYGEFQEVLAGSALSPKHSQAPHMFYALAGAASMIFAVAPECRRLTGLNPAGKAAVEAHAEYVARLFVP